METSPLLPDDIWHLLVDLLSNRHHVRLWLVCRAGKRVTSPLVRSLIVNTQSEGWHAPSKWCRNGLLRWHDDVVFGSEMPTDFPPCLDAFVNIRTLDLDTMRAPRKRFQLMLTTTLLKLERLTCDMDWLVTSSTGVAIGSLPKLTWLKALTPKRLAFCKRRLLHMPRLAELVINYGVNMEWLAEQLAVAMPSLASLNGPVDLYDNQNFITARAPFLHAMTIVANVRRHSLLGGHATTLAAVVPLLTNVRQLTYYSQDLVLHKDDLAALARLPGLQSLELDCEAGDDDETVLLQDSDERPRNLRVLKVDAWDVYLYKNALALAISNAATLTDLRLRYRRLAGTLDSFLDKRVPLSKLQKLGLERVFLPAFRMLEFADIARTLFPSLDSLELCDADVSLSGLLRLPTLGELAILRTTSAQLWGCLQNLATAAHRTSLRAIKLDTNGDDYRDDKCLPSKPTWPEFLLAPQRFMSLRSVHIKLEKTIHCPVICAILYAAPVLRQLHVLAEIEDWPTYYYALLGALCVHREIDYVVLLRDNNAAALHADDSLVHNFPRTLFVDQQSTPFMQRFLCSRRERPTGVDNGNADMLVCQFPLVEEGRLRDYFYRRAVQLNGGADVAASVADDACKFLTREHLEDFFAKYYYQQ